jgi:hypothetical protein
MFLLIEKPRRKCYSDFRGYISPKGGQAHEDREASKWFQATGLGLLHVASG